MIQALKEDVRGRALPFLDELFATTEPLHERKAPAVDIDRSRLPIHRRGETAKLIFQQVDSTAKIMLVQSMDTLEDLKSARIFFERGIVRETAQKITDDDIAELREIIERQRESLGDAEHSLPPIWSFMSG